MLSREISEAVLTIGNECRPPKGGMAQVVFTYGKTLFKPFHFISFYNGGSSINKIYCFLTALVKTICFLLFRRKIKIVHIHTGSATSFKRSSYFIKLSKWMHKKVVLHMHGGGFMEYYKGNSNYVDGIIKKVDVVVALTDRWKLFYEHIGCKKVCTVPNIIEEPQIALVPQKSTVHFLFLGLICDNKGIFDLLEVLAANKTTLKDKMILHIGGNGETSRLQTFIKEHELEELAVFEGWVSGDKKTALLNQCDCYILPSYIEGLPISILEALSFGKFVVSTKVGGIPEIVNDDNGLLFDSGNKTELWDALKYTLDHIETIRLSQPKIAATVEKHLPEAVSRNLESLYQELL